jgi:membrane-associated protease RseP (regulator of RpoE activity)
MVGLEVIRRAVGSPVRRRSPDWKFDWSKRSRVIMHRISKNSIWYGGLALALAVFLVALVTDGATAGSKDKEKEPKTKGYLGVYMQKLDKDVREGLDLDVDEGVLINGVEEGSPADEAGIEEGDVVVEFDGKKVSSPDDLRALVGESEVGKEVEVKVIRDGKQKTVRLVVGELPDDLGWATMGDFGSHWRDKGLDKLVYAFALRPRLGVEAVELNKDLAPYFKTKAGEGVLVLEVKDESAAEEAGIKAGDVIQKVGDETVSSVDDLRESLEDFEEGDEVAIVVLRNGKTKTLTATMKDVDENFIWSGWPHSYRYRAKGLPHHYEWKSPDIEIQRYKGDVENEIQELKKELKELKKEIRELKKQ